MLNRRHLSVAEALMMLARPMNPWYPSTGESILKESQKATAKDEFRRNQTQRTENKGEEMQINSFL